MRTPVSILLLATALAAQGVTSPRGFNAVEGNTVFSHFTGSRRLQQIDYTQNGAPLVISSLAFRRNGGVASASIRTFDFKVDLGRCDFGAYSTKLDSNFIAGTRTTVFNQTAVSFPDWSAPQPTPAPFDFKVVFPAPYVYLGLDALVIDFEHTNNSTTAGLSIDREFNGPTSPPAGALLGTGCIATGNSLAFAHTANAGNYDSVPTTAYGFRLRVSGTNPPAAGGVVCFLDAVNQNLSGLLCSTVYAFPLVTLPLASSGTAIEDVGLGFTYNPSLIGATVYSQLAAFDAGQTPIPVVVSNGRATSIPGTPSAGVQHRCSYGWYSIPSTTGFAASAHFTGGGIVMLLQ